jgi:hypothetical protein
MAKRFTVTVIAYAVVSLAVGMAWYMLLFKGLYAELGIFNRENPLFPLGISSMLLQGIVFAYLYPRLFRGVNPLVEGIKFSILMEAIMFSIATLANGAKIHVAPLGTWILVQSGFHILHALAFGICLALIYQQAIVRR